MVALLIQQGLKFSVLGRTKEKTESQLFHFQYDIGTGRANGLREFHAILSVMNI